MAEIPSEKRAEPLDPHREREIKRDFLIGIAIALLFILLYQGLEALWMRFGMQRFGHALVQYLIPPANHPPVVVLNIVKLAPERAKTMDPNVDSMTPRQPLLDLISAVANQDPAAIGVDIDFSSSDGGFLTKDDQKFFDQVLAIKKEKKSLPIFLGVARAQVTPARQRRQNILNRHWLGDSKYDPLAASILIPTDTQTMLASFSTPHAPALMSMSVALADAYLRYINGGRAPELTQMPGRPWSWFVSSTVPWNSAEGFSALQYLMDYGALGALMHPLPTTSPATIADEHSQLKDKIVLLGDDPGSKGDAFRLPFLIGGIRDPNDTYPGVYFHASGAYTLVRPLFWLHFWSRTAIDILLCIGALSITLWVRLYYLHHRHTTQVATYRLNVLGFSLAALIVLTGVLFVRYTRVVWDDWLLIVLVLWSHPMIERHLVEGLAWARSSLPRFLDRIALDRRASSVLILVTLICMALVSLIACGPHGGYAKPGGREATPKPEKHHEFVTGPKTTPEVY